MPFHQGRDISPTLLRQIAKDVGLPVEDFLAGKVSQQPNKALQPAAGASQGAKKPFEPGRG